MQVEIWSDVVCPWCYIAKRRFEAALERFGHPDEVEVVWRSFELDPTAPADDDRPMAALIAARYRCGEEEATARLGHVTSIAAGDGLEYRLDLARRQNTYDAHRVLHLARDRGLQAVAEERFLRACLSEGIRLTDEGELVRVAATVGLDAAEVADVLASDRYGDEVRSDEARARTIGAHGVPHFLVDGKYAVAGAQDATRFVQLLDRAWVDGRRAEPPLLEAEGR